jgi:hypothetical protein
MRSFRTRDSAAAVMRAVRVGDFEAIAPGSFSEDYPGPIIANTIDTMARDAVASLTMLPSINCIPSHTLEDKAKKFAAIRTKIARYYVESSGLQVQMSDIADNYKCYGLAVLKVEPCFDDKAPRMRAVDGSQCYPVWNKDRETIECVEVQYISSYTLEADFPGVSGEIDSKFIGQLDRDRIKVITYENDTQTLIYLPDCGNHVLLDIPNEMGACTYVAVPRNSGKGGWHTVPQGAYDALVYPLLAANEFRMLALEATDKAVRAPIVVPMDVTDVSFGPDATIRTQNPQSVQRLRIEVPPTAFQSSDILDRDVQKGGMSPASRSGQVTASVITGRGVDALGEGYSAQIALDQTRLSVMIHMAIAMCFEMDEKLWPNETKNIRGSEADNSFQLSYTPAKDINGDYTVAVEYGFLLGLDANRSLIWVLQAQAAGLISTDTASRNLPVKLDTEEEQNKIKLEQLRGSIVQAMAGISQSLPQMIGQGADPSAMMAKLAALIEGVKKGLPIETVASQVFAPPPPPPADSAPGMSAPPGAPGSDAGGAGQPAAPGGPGGGALGQPAVNASGQAGGPPDIAGLIAGMSASGQPRLGGSVSRRNPVQGQ